jgi:hypothetical protein
MEERFFFRRSESDRELLPLVPLTGEVIFESVHQELNKKLLKKFVHRTIELRLEEIRGEANWASYLVILSPGQEADEIRCQVDVETDGNRAAFAVGYGQSPNLAFNDAVERMQWSEKRESTRMII